MKNHTLCFATFALSLPLSLLATQVENVDQLASRLDRAGDGGNLPATQDNQAGLSDALDTIHDLYPAATFK